MVTPKKQRSGSPDPNALFNEDESDEGAAVQDTEPAPARLGFEARLVVERGPHAGKVLKLGGGIAAIGRSSKCELSLKASSGVSRRHCQVQLIGDNYAVIDLESRNGTVVNGDVTERKILVDGDVIEVGDEVIRFVSTRKAAAPPPIEDDDDVSERETELHAPAPIPLPPKASRSSSALKAQKPAEKSSSAMKAQKPAKRAPPPPPITAPPPVAPFESDEGDLGPPRGAPADPTQSYFYDPDVVAQAESGDDVDDVPPPLPPLPPERSRSRSGARGPPPREERSRAAVPVPPPRAGSGAAMKILVIVALLVVVALVAAAYDTLLGSQNLLALLRGRTPPLLAETAPPADDVVVKPPPADVVATPPAKPPADVDVAKPPPAEDDVKPPPPPPPPAPAPPVVVAEVTASSGGRIASVKVKPGAVVAKGAVIATLEGSVPHKKIEALREEEQAFAAAAAKGSASAKRDLADVRAEIAEVERHARPSPLVSDQDGTVDAVLVKPGDVVKAGHVLIRVAP